MQGEYFVEINWLESKKEWNLRLLPSNKQLENKLYYGKNIHVKTKKNKNRQERHLSEQHQEAPPAQKFDWYLQRAQDIFYSVQECHQKP